MTNPFGPLDVFRRRCLVPLVAELAKPQGTAPVLAWAAAQDETLLFLSILTLGEYDKGFGNLPPDSPLRLHIAAGIAALEVRFAGRILPLTNAIVRRWSASPVP